MALEFRLPDIGEGVVEGEVTRWMVNEGDVVRDFGADPSGQRDATAALQQALDATGAAGGWATGTAGGATRAATASPADEEGTPLSSEAVLMAELYTSASNSRRGFAFRYARKPQRFRTARRDESAD